jgi:phosphopantothenoylcysteine decarboxylase/phosphopantothenate--cysteine ligase
MESSLLAGKKILLGITGGIASYKVAEWVRALTAEGADIHVVMTDSGTRFVSPITFAALSGNPVHTDTFSSADADQIPHIKLAKAAELVLIAPATANTIAKLAHGIADDLLSTIVLATKAKVLVCPTMNSNMFCHKATQDNLKRLKEFDYSIIDPAEGALACGDNGPGRLPEWDTVRHKILTAFADQDLKGMNILITAGPTNEMIDPVRFIGNRSSGKMGYALAVTAARRGADVTLISGPTSLKCPTDVTCINVVSAETMYNEVMKHAEKASVIVKAAAVADFKPATISSQKIKKSGADLSLNLSLCKDILNELGKQKQSCDTFPLLVGFAAESENHIQEGKRKLTEKNLDLIIVNDILSEETGFASDTNRVTLINKNENIIELPLLSKEETADHIWNTIIRLVSEK